MSTEPLSLKELHPQDIVILTLLKGKVILKELFDLFSTIQEEEHHWSKLILEIPTDISIELNIF